MCEVCEAKEKLESAIDDLAKTGEDPMIYQLLYIRDRMEQAGKSHHMFAFDDGMVFELNLVTGQVH